jgi:hypothetical protein
LAPRLGHFQPSPQQGCKNLLFLIDDLVFYSFSANFIYSLPIVQVFYRLWYLPSASQLIDGPGGIQDKMLTCLNTLYILLLEVFFMYTTIKGVGL